MQQKNLELKVGLFIVFGLLSAGILIVSFGRFGELFQDSYQLTVKFENTDGVIKNSQVLYRGARVGTVSTSPQIAGEGKYVIIGIKINDDVMIDQASTFEVGSYGLLGDRFIDVLAPKTPTGKYFKDGDEVVGSTSVGLSDLAGKIDPVITRINQIIADLDEKGVVDNVSASMESIKGITEKLDHIMEQAESGKGPVYTLLNDEETADDIREMITEFKTLGENLRKKGILFYRDLSEDEEKESSSRIQQYKGQ